MSKDERDLLDLLTFELKFLEDGGYGRSPRTPWLRQRAFEDSLSCPNFRDPARPHPCSECLLMQFVPIELRDQPSPCRLIPLNDKGETIDYFYRCGTQLELEEAFAGWLRKQISQIKEQDKSSAEAGGSGSSKELDRIRRRQWLALAGNLYSLANLQRDNHNYVAAHALYGRAVAATERIGTLEEAGRSLVARMKRDQQEVSEILHAGDTDRERAPSEEFQMAAPR
jgi:hypothetical protein